MAPSNEKLRKKQTNHLLNDHYGLYNEDVFYNIIIFQTLHSKYVFKQQVNYHYYNEFKTWLNYSLS